MKILKSSSAHFKTSKQFNLFSAIAAFILWGGWAYYVNQQTDFNSGLISGLTQGLASFTITLIMVKSVTWLYHQLRGTLLKLILPAFITVGTTGSCLVLIHTAVNTPSIAKTVTPALSVAFMFCLFTGYKLYNIGQPKDS